MLVVLVVPVVVLALVDEARLFRSFAKAGGGRMHGAVRECVRVGGLD